MEKKKKRVVFLREIYEAYAIHCRRRAYYAPLRAALAPPRVPGPDDTDFDWSHEGEAFLFPWFTTVMCDGRFLAPAGYPARQESQEILSRHVSSLRSYDDIRIQTDSYRPFINKLFIVCSVPARCQRNNRCFRKSCLNGILTGYRAYLMRFVIDFNEGEPLYLAPLWLSDAIKGNKFFVTKEIAATWEDDSKNERLCFNF